MLETFEYHPWPVRTNNVAWSADNIVATAIAGNIELLVPSYTSIGSSWQTVTLNASNFSQQEVPLLEPAPWSSFDLAEELSEKEVTSHAWSPPGLARHGTCALAVLTSNHILSIWECTGRPSSAADWQRVLIVNSVLETSPSTSNTSLKRCKRVRSFDWLPVPLSPQDQDGIGGRLTRHTFHLAVGDDASDIHLVRVKLHQDSFVRQEHVPLKTVLAVKASSSIPSANVLLTMLPSRLEARPNFVDQISCSPWDRSPDGALFATLAFTLSDRLCSMRLQTPNTTDDTLEAEQPMPISLPEMPDKISGPIQWAPRLSKLGSLLVFFSTTDIFCLSVAPVEGVRLSSEPLNTRWNRIAGSYFAVDENANVTLTFSTFQNAQLIERLVFNLPLQEKMLESEAQWQKNLKEFRNSQDAKDENRDHTLVRSYGLAVSPLGDQSATCVTTHLDNGVEYLILTAQSGTMIVSREQISPDSVLQNRTTTISPWQISAESMFAFLRNTFNNKRDKEPPLDPVLLAQGLMKVTASPNVAHSVSLNGGQSMDHDQIATHLRKTLLYDQDIAIARLTRLVQLARDGVEVASKPDLTIVKRVLTAVKDANGSISDDSPFGKLIVQNCMMIASQIAARENQSADADLANGQVFEKCETCQSDIAFEALRWGRCPKNHRFMRCGLTFLTIQSKGKQCGICDTHFLNEYADGIATQGATGLTMLPRVILAACDNCVYCGGRFVG